MVALAAKWCSSWYCRPRRVESEFGYDRGCPGFRQPSWVAPVVNHGCGSVAESAWALPGILSSLGVTLGGGLFGMGFDSVRFDVGVDLVPRILLDGLQCGAIVWDPTACLVGFGWVETNAERSFVLYAGLRCLPKTNGYIVHIGDMCNKGPPGEAR